MCTTDKVETTTGCAEGSLLVTPMHAIGWTVSSPAPHRPLELSTEEKVGRGASWLAWEDRGGSALAAARELSPCPPDHGCCFLLAAAWLAGVHKSHWCAKQAVVLRRWAPQLLPPCDSPSPPSSPREVSRTLCFVVGTGTFFS